MSTKRLILSWAKQEKANARGGYHDEESGSFEQGLKLGRLHAMSDVIEFIRENSEAATAATDDDMLDVTVTVGDAECEVSSSRVTDYEQRRVSIQLPSDSFAEFIRELRLNECNSDAQAWLEEHEPQEGNDD